MNERILQIRRLIGDPVASSINYADPLPDNALDRAVYTTGDGAYQARRYGAWKPVKIQIDDVEIERMDTAANIYVSALTAVNALIARINPLDYITSGNAGAQSVGFPSLADVLAFFNAKKAAIASMAAEAGDVQRAGWHPVPVGGVFDWERPC
jgi:hypothetical protein